MTTTATEARRLFAKLDKIEREKLEIERRLNELRSQYMRENSTCGLHPVAFRREVENIRKAA